MALASSMNLAVSANLTSALDLVNASAPLALQATCTLTSGTGANQADLVFSDTRTLTASSTEDLDLAGVLTNAFGTTLTFARVKGLYVSAAAANTNSVIVGAAAGSPWTTMLGATGTVTLPPSGWFAAACPTATAWAVTATSADLLKIANSAGSTSVTYSIVIIGASA